VSAPASVAVQGEPGAFSHAAALGLLGSGVRVVFEPDFDALFESLARGRAGRALVPLENSLHGSIHENYDRLQASGARIVGETLLRVEQCLVARPGTPLEAVRRVASHPVALAQCRRFFAARPGVEPVVAADTAGAVRLLMEGALAADAALASSLAAETYGAAVLLAGVEDDPENYTRFALLAGEAVEVAGADKTSLVLTLPNVPGSLHRALGCFAARGLDLAKLESRPLRGRPFEYAFYLDVLGDPSGPLRSALEELGGFARELRVLGSYARAALPEAGPAG
jgi:prephenate dehydratase